MKEPATASEIGLSAIYVLIVAAVLCGVDLAFGWVLNNSILNIFNWFNRLNIGWKIFILIAGGVTLLFLMFTLFAAVSRLLTYFIFRHFPTNGFTLTVSTLFAIANTVFLVVKIWKLPTHYNFWIVMELIFLSLFAWSLASIVATKKEYEQEFSDVD